jgi:hypothetical protein
MFLMKSDTNAARPRACNMTVLVPSAVPNGSSNPIDSGDMMPGANVARTLCFVTSPSSVSDSVALSKLPTSG